MAPRMHRFSLFRALITALACIVMPNPHLSTTAKDGTPRKAARKSSISFNPLAHRRHDTRQRQGRPDIADKDARIPQRRRCLVFDTFTPPSTARTELEGDEDYLRLKRDTLRHGGREFRFLSMMPMLQPQRFFRANCPTLKWRRSSSEASGPILRPRC